MITLKMKQLRDPQFMGAMQKLSTLDLPHKSAYTVAKIFNKLISEAKIEAELFKKIVLRYAVLDDKGEIKTPEGKEHGAFEIIEGKEEEYQKAINEHLEGEFTIEWRKITLAELEGTKLRALDFVPLSDIIDEKEALKVIPGGLN